MERMNIIEALEWQILNDKVWVYTKKDNYDNDEIETIGYNLREIKYCVNEIKNKWFFKTHDEARNYYLNPWFSLDEVIKILYKNPNQRIEFYSLFPEKIFVKIDEKSELVFLNGDKKNIQHKINDLNMTYKWFRYEPKTAKVIWDKTDFKLWLEYEDKRKELFTLNKNNMIKSIWINPELSNIFNLKDRKQLNDLEILKFVGNGITEIEY